MFTLVTSFKIADPLNRGYTTQDFLGFQAFGIESNSMYPKIEVGDVVLMRITDENTDIDEGDIVAYKLNDVIVVHRVKQKISDEEYITQGDNNNMDDGVIYREEIIAKNVLVIPKLGLLMNIINPVKNILGFITFILFVGATFFFCDSLVKITDPYFNYKSKKEEDED